MKKWKLQMKFLFLKIRMTRNSQGSFLSFRISNRKRRRSISGSCTEDDLLRLVFKEKSKSQMLEQQTKHLIIQAATVQKVKAEFRALF